MFINCLFFFSRSQSLVINEVSQGPAGLLEYVELLVVGTPTCNSIPTLDIRDWIVDDNNGSFGTSGIVNGFVRFNNNPMWQNMPIGTIILIYDQVNQNALIPAPDISMADGNCRLVIPITNCTLFSAVTVSPPSFANPAYPPSGSPTICPTSWQSHIAMGNNDDSFQIRDPSATLVHAVSWGNNTITPVISFAGSATGRVMSMVNTINNNAFTQGNWVNQVVAGNETPGLPNNAANAAWINSMNNSCSPLLSFTSSVSSTSAGCTCNGSATIAASGAIAPYTYTWFPSGGNSPVANGLCTNIYTISSTSSNGCIQTLTVDVGSAGTVSATIANTSVTCVGLSNGSATITPSGGTGPYTYTWSPSGGNTVTASGLAAGSYTVILQDANNCTTTAITTLTANPLPTATVSNNGPLCAGQTLILVGGGPGNTYLWNGPLGYTSTAQNPTIAVSNTINTGSYTLVVTDANTCTNSAITSVTVSSAPLASAGNSGPLCSGNSLNLTGSGGGTYQWFGPNSYTSSFQNPFIAASSPSMSGTYSVLVTIGTCTAAATTSVTINTSPSASASNSGPLCSGQLITLNGNGGGTYSWSGPAGFSSNSQNPVITATATSNYTLTVIGANSCTNSAITSVSVNPSPSAVANGSSACVGSTFNLSASGGTNFLWVGPNSFTSSVQNPTINNAAISNSGTYTVIVTGANSCTSTANATVIINPTPLATAVGTDVCAGNSLSLIASGGSTYLWSGPNNFTTTNQIPVINNVSVNYSGIYSVTASNGNCSNTATVNITIHPLPNVTATANSINFCIDATASLFASGGTSFSWSGPAGFNSILQNPIVAGLTESNEGIYSVTTSDSKGCTSSTSLLITVDVCDTCVVFIPEGFSPNNDGAHDTFSITCIEGRKTKVEIFNRWGNLVYLEENYLNTWNGKINSGLQIAGEDLPAGTYYYIIKIEDEEKTRTGFITLWR